MTVADLPAILGRSEVTRINVHDACVIWRNHADQPCSRQNIDYHRRVGNLPDYDMRRAWSPELFITAINNICKHQQL